LGEDKGKRIAHKVYFTKRCELRYKKLQDSIKRTVAKTIEEISENPNLGYPLKDRLLKDLYSIHCGDFRIVYKFNENPGQVEIWAIEHRSHVYEELLRYRSASS
jgi:mRNA-degrading endonuclease RelE of RelBE toxin-antitoxin system